MAITPGPWLIADEKADVAIVAFDQAAQHERVIAYCAIDGDTTANARLIAAAPELLEALKDMAADFRALDLPYGNRAYQQAIAAINKAEGN
jgi:hypothetical protein